MAGPILIVCGTNRPLSNSMKVAQVVGRHYAALGTPAEVYSLTDLPGAAFAPEAFAVKPPELVAVQQKVVESAGLHLIVPEYNGSFPGVLKHFIDLLKFPESFQDKPVAFVGAASGTWGGLRGVEQLQMVFAYRNAHLFPDRVFIPGVGKRLDADGCVTDPDIDARLAKQAAGFARFAGLLGRP
jgi:NAD(P)H-dependent FMN reductase